MSEGNGNDVDGLLLSFTPAQLRQLAAEIAVLATRKGGITCPGCKRHLGTYTRRIYARVALALIYFARYDRERPGSFHEIKRFDADVEKLHRFKAGSKTGDHAKLCWPEWGLLERAVDEHDKFDVDMYRITAKGRAFVRGTVLVPEYLIEFKSLVIHVSTELVDIRACLGAEFDYREVVGTLFDPPPTHQPRLV